MSAPVNPGSDRASGGTRSPAPELVALGPVHLIGIGGAGMSAIARLLLGAGVPVSGSDANAGPVLAELDELGAKTFVGHRAEQLGAARTVVVSTAVRESNPELAAARERELTVLHRSEALVACMTGTRQVAVAGTHGKTTTSAMVTVALRAAGLDPSYAIGAELTGGGGNAHSGADDVFVIEADESDGSFIRYRPQVAVVTNVEPDHLDYYGTAEAVAAAFVEFGDRLVPGGTLVACLDDPGAAQLVDRLAGPNAAARVRVFGYRLLAAPPTEADWLDGADATAGMLLTWPDSGSDAPGAARSGPVAGWACAWRLAAGAIGADGTTRLPLRVPGRHNARNATAALGVALALGQDGPAAARGLAEFVGTRRRFEFKGDAAGVSVYDDYAHHPTEVAAVLQAARAHSVGRRVVAVFQPHLYSRTKIFATDFATALGAADQVLVLDVYRAREDPDPSVTGELISSQVPLPVDRVAFTPDQGAALEVLVATLRTGDLVLTIGAGDITTLGPKLLARLAATSSTD